MVGLLIALGISAGACAGALETCLEILLTLLEMWLGEEVMDGGGWGWGGPRTLLSENLGLAQQGTCAEATGFRALFDLFPRHELWPLVQDLVPIRPRGRVGGCMGGRPGPNVLNVPSVRALLLEATTQGYGYSM